MVVEVKNVYKKYADKQVLENVSMVFKQGITSIMGASGRGKTTLAYIMAGLVKPDSGEVLGQKKISFMFQEDRLLEWESALSNVLFVKDTPLFSKKYIDKATYLLNQAELNESIFTKAYELSGGMKRRVSLCRALIADFDLLILDEPFKGLDENLKYKIMDMVKEHTDGKTVICITHDINEAKYLGGEIIDF